MDITIVIFMIWLVFLSPIIDIILVRKLHKEIVELKEFNKEGVNYDDDKGIS